MKESCEYCKYWYGMVFRDQGDCKKRAPLIASIIVTMDRHESSEEPSFPVTRNEDWCGDWKRISLSCPGCLKHITELQHNEGSYRCPLCNAERNNTEPFKVRR